MRTVTFSDPRIQQLFNQQFVNTHTNTEGDPTAGQSIRHRPGEPAGTCIRGNGKQNIQTIFMTPAGEIFHAATGFLSADDLLAEAGYAVQLFGELKQAETNERAERVVDSHRERLKALGGSSAFDDMAKRFSSLNPSTARQAINGTMSGGSIDPSRMFQEFAHQQIRQDQQFSINHPLITCQQLERNPEMLVGNGKSFFASSSSGNNR